MSLLERVFYFHQEVQKAHFPNSRTLAAHFETSVATSKRDIVYLRDRLLAPLSFDHDKNGYFYKKESFILPFEDSPGIVFLLTMLNKLAGEAGLGELPEVKQLEGRLSSMISSDYGKLVDRISCEWIEVEPIDHRIFASLTEGIVEDKTVKILYRSLKGENSSREVAPRRIINYQGRWYLLADCRLRRASRLFHVARIRRAEVTGRAMPSDPCPEPELLLQSFGIFGGPPLCHARILFTSTAAELVRHQHWHRDQTIEEVDEGLCLSLPVSDYREITMKILQYGAMARVISPPELKQRVEDEILSMARHCDFMGHPA
ncbi:MAG: WYL domain-containing protein [Deltaproteobacteria bacterium]|nr:WYL domain-containing protein [Deltaproteobacteria bacterium]